MINDKSIKDEDRFTEARYPEVAKEVADLHLALAGAEEVLKVEMVISFVRHHRLKTEWLTQNREVARMLTSGSPRISNIESLFNASRNNVRFTDDLEGYLKLKFSKQNTAGGSGVNLI